MMSYDEEDEIPEWEQHDEEVPPSLEKKWKKRGQDGAKKIQCKSCGQEIDDHSLLCLYCGNRTGIKAGFFGALRALLLESWGLVIFLLILFCVILFLSYSG